MINLWDITSLGMDEKLEKKVKKDVSKFKLFLGDINNKKVEVTKPYEDTNLVILNCKGIITHFEFPKSSKNNKFENVSESKKKYGEISINFNYHNSFYRIYGLI